MKWPFQRRLELCAARTGCGDLPRELLDRTARVHSARVRACSSPLSGQLKSSPAAPPICAHQKADRDPHPGDWPHLGCQARSHSAEGKLDHDCDHNEPTRSVRRRTVRQSGKLRSTPARRARPPFASARGRHCVDALRNECKDRARRKAGEKALDLRAARRAETRRDRARTSHGRPIHLVRRVVPHSLGGMGNQWPQEEASSSSAGATVCPMT